MALQFVTGALVNTASAVTTTITISPTGTIVLFIWARHGSADFTTGTTLSGNGMTWAKVGEVIEVGGQHSILTVWVGYAAAPTAGTQTITFSQTPSGGIYAQYVTSDHVAADPTSGAATNSGSGTSGTVTLAAATAGKHQFVAFYHQANEGTTPSAVTTWVEVSDQQNANGSMEVQRGAGAVACAASWGTSIRWNGVAFEITADSLEGEDLLAEAFLSGSTGEAGHPNAELLGTEEEQEPHGVWAILGGPGS
jgi:hypothetical protein